MAGFKTINPVSPGVFRAVQASDLQDIWDGISNALASDTVQNISGGAPHPFVPYRIVSGLRFGNDGFLTPGAIAYNGKLYYYDGSSNIQSGTSLYAHTNDGDKRTLANGELVPFCFVNVINDVADGGTFVGVASEQFLTQFRVAALLGNDSVRDSNIQSVSSKKVLPGSVSFRQAGGTYNIPNGETVILDSSGSADYTLNFTGNTGTVIVHPNGVGTVTLQTTKNGSVVTIAQSSLQIGIAQRFDFVKDQNGNFVVTGYQLTAFGNSYAIQ